jgi:hypothetical protein
MYVSKVSDPNATGTVTLLSAPVGAPLTTVVVLNSLDKTVKPVRKLPAQRGDRVAV